VRRFQCQIPEHRKKGIGKMLTDYVDAKAKEVVP
jgi:hypothetical protein